MRVLLEIRYNLAKPLISAKVYTVWQKIYLVAKVKNYWNIVILIEINRDLVLLVIKVNLYISVAWETVECEKIVNANCKKRYKANRLKLPKVIETMIYLEVANSFKILQRYRIWKGLYGNRRHIWYWFDVASCK